MMITSLARSLKWILLGAVVVYLIDWLSLEMRLGSYRNGLGKVVVSQYLATPLKGQKEEYDYLGQVEQPCVKSIFPHNSDLPCWWLERHKNQWQ
jgi:hypothetical protein